MLVLLGNEQDFPWLSKCRLFSVSDAIPDTYRVLLSGQELDITANCAIHASDISFTSEDASKAKKIAFSDILQKTLKSDRSDGLIPTIVVNEFNQALGRV